MFWTPIVYWCILLANNLLFHLGWILYWWRSLVRVLNWRRRIRTTKNNCLLFSIPFIFINREADIIFLFNYIDLWSSKHYKISFIIINICCILDILLCAFSANATYFWYFYFIFYFVCNASEFRIRADIFHFKQGISKH